MGNSKEGTVFAMSAGKLRAAQDKFWNEFGQGARAIAERFDDNKDFRRKIADFAIGLVVTCVVFTDQCGKLMYFVGASLQDILQDASNSKRFISAGLPAYEVVCYPALRERCDGLGGEPPLLKAGVDLILAGERKSFCVHIT